MNRIWIPKVVVALCLVTIGALLPFLLPSIDFTQAAGVKYELNTKVVIGDERFISDVIITDLSTATTLTVPARARYAWSQAQEGNIRFRWGTAPDATTGGIISAGDSFTCNASLSEFQIIQESDADAYVAFFR